MLVGLFVLISIFWERRTQRPLGKINDLPHCNEQNVYPIDKNDGANNNLKINKIHSMNIPNYLIIIHY